MQLLSIWRGGHCAAWAAAWTLDEMEGHKLVAIPKLCLSQEVTLELTDRIPYAQVFGEAVVQLQSDPPRRFYVVHATFDLYRTSAPELSGFAVLVPDPALPLPKQAAVIARTAQMLRGED